MQLQPSSLPFLLSFGTARRQLRTQLHRTGMSLTASDSRSMGGLSHLVEAASALSKLPDVESYQHLAVSSVPSDSTLTTNESQTPNLVVSDDDEDSNVCAKHVPVASKDIFPQRLFEILQGPFSHIISWLPHGCSFVIVRPDVFSCEVLPRFFPSSDSRSNTKYASFTRKLNRWGFRQATRGPDTGAFYHPSFRRDQPDLCVDMVCQKSRKRSSPSKRANGGRPVKSSTESSSRKPIEATACVTKLTKETLATLPTSEPHHQSKTISVDSSDDPRLSPSPPSSPGSLLDLPSPAYRPPIPGALLFPSPWVPTDPTLVAKALRDREEREKLTIAKAMLYQAFMDAMKN